MIRIQDWCKFYECVGSNSDKYHHIILQIFTQRYCIAFPPTYHSRVDLFSEARLFEIKPQGDQNV